MRFRHLTFEEQNQRLDEVTDEKEGTRIRVTDQGAELVSLAKRRTEQDWVGYLYRDADVSIPASGGKNHATVMGYEVHRLLGERSL
jgi:hypothetical protein